MTDLNLDYELLAKAIALHMDRHNPTTITLWNVEDCAYYLRQAKTTFRDFTSKHPTFPSPIRVPNLRGRSSALWRAKDVIAWTEAHHDS